MKVVLWAGAFPPEVGGVEQFNRRLRDGLEDLGHEVLVIENSRFPFKNVLQSRDLEAIARLRRRVRETVESFRPEVEQISCIGANGFFYRKTVPLVVTLHQRTPGQNSTLQGRVLAQADRVVGVSRWLGCPTTIYPGLPTPPPPSPLGKNLVCLGRLAPEKGFDRAIRALEGTQARLILAGDGPERGVLQELAGDRVEFRGWVHPDRVPQLLASAYLVLVPSREESFGLSALEASAAGRPVVGCPVGGLPEVVEHERTGLLVQPDELSGAVARLLEDPQRAHRMGRAGWERVCTHFTLEAMSKAYSRLFQELREPHRSSSAAP